MTAMAATKMGARSGGQAPLLGLVLHREGNPALCRWPRGFEGGECGHSAGTDIGSLPRRGSAPSRRILGKAQGVGRHGKLPPDDTRNCPLVM